MNLQSKALKTIAICVIVVFMTVTLRVDLLMAATRTKAQSPAQQKVTSSVRFQTLLKDTEKLLEGMGADLERKRDVSAKLKELRRNRSDLQDLVDTIRVEFTKTREELIAKELPPEIIQRHDAFVQNFEDNFKTLLMDLDEIEKPREGGLSAILKGLAGVEKAEINKKRVEAAREHLKKNIYRKKHIPLDPNKLPHRRSDLKPRKPITDPKEFKKLFPKNQQSSLSGSGSTVLSSILGIGTAYAQEDPIDPYLAETIEVQFTQEIQDLAASLNHDPVKIYEWVRNNIEFVPTYGSIQGANMTLLSKQGNAFDTASLLIALLRVSNIPARYVYGTIEVPIDKVMNWVGGFTDEKSAADFIASGGVPITAGISGGEITAVRMEHVWVEAFVDYIPSRGAVHKEGDTWIPLDGSFKQYTYTPGIDLQQAVPFDAQTFVDQVKATGTVNEAESFVTGFDQTIISQKFDERRQQLDDFITANMSNATVEDVLGRIAIIPQTSGILASTLPYQLIVRATTFSELPDTLRHKLFFRIVEGSGGPSLVYEAPISTLAGKRITLSYLPATQQDQQQIEARIDQFSLPAYLINLVPILRLEGAEVARGETIGLGKAQQFLMEFNVPAAGGVIDIVQNTITAGAYYAIGIDPQMIPSTHLDQLEQRMVALKQQLESDPTFFPDTDDIIGQLLQVTITGYFAELDNYQAILGGLSQVRNLKPSTAAGMASVDLNVDYLFGSPFAAASSGGITLDVDRFISAPFSTSGDKNSTISFVKGSGFLGSALEFALPEQVWESFNIRGISTTKVLELANQSNIPIYRINGQNLAQILPQLSVTQAVKNDIVNVINAGKEVTIPQQEISIGSWSGIGYIVEDPDTGAAAYLISGGLAGGASIDIIDLITGIIASLIAAKYTKFGRGLGIIGALITYVKGIRTIIVTPNLDVLERAILAAIAGIGLILAVLVVTAINPFIWAIVATIAVSILFSLLFTYLLEEMSQAFLDFLDRLYRYANRRYIISYISSA